MSIKFRNLRGSKKRQPIERTFIWAANNAAKTELSVTLEYMPKEVMQEGEEKAKKRILGSRRFTQIEDQDNDNKQYIHAIAELLASRVKKVVRVDGAKVTIQDMAALTEVDPEVVADATASEAGLNTTIEMDADDVCGLIESNAQFRDWVVSILSDISYFQDKDYWIQVPNSETGAATSLAA